MLIECYFLMDRHLDFCQIAPSAAGIYLKSFESVFYFKLKLYALTIVDIVSVAKNRMKSNLKIEGQN